MKPTVGEHMSSTAPSTTVNWLAQHLLMPCGGLWLSWEDFENSRKDDTNLGVNQDLKATAS